MSLKPINDQNAVTMTKEKDDQIPSILNNNVTMSNVVARAAQSLSLVEKRIVVGAVSMLDSRKKVIDYSLDKNRTFKITAKDYAEIAQLKRELDAYRDIAKAADKLLERTVKRAVMTPKGRKIIKTNWLEQAEYHEGEGWIEVCFTAKIMPHLVELKNKFTKYRLAQTAGIRSVYSWRLLEYLTSWQDNKKEQGSRFIELAKFKEMMEIPESYKWYDIKRKVIEQAIKELSEKDGWQVSFKQIKTGRKVTGIDFNWEKQAQGDLFK